MRKIALSLAIATFFMFPCHAQDASLSKVYCSLNATALYQTNVSPTSYFGDISFVPHIGGEIGVSISPRLINHCYFESGFYMGKISCEYSDDYSTEIDDVLRIKIPLNLSFLWPVNNNVFGFTFGALLGTSSIQSKSNGVNYSGSEDNSGPGAGIDIGVKAIIMKKLTMGLGYEFFHNAAVEQGLIAFSIGYSLPDKR